MSASSNQTETGAEPQPVFRSNSEIAVHVANLEKAEYFYAEVLGFKLLAKTTRQLEFDTGKLRLYVNLDSRPLTSFVPTCKPFGAMI